MLPSYSDITSRLGKPLWYDKHGVPRYDPFHPDMCGVYANFVAFMEIECQACGGRFRVAVDRRGWELIGGEIVRPTLPSLGDVGSFCYDDPPPHDVDGGMCAGSTMSSVVRRILEFWVRDQSTNFEWIPLPEYEFTY